MVGSGSLSALTLAFMITAAGCLQSEVSTERSGGQTITTTGDSTRQSSGNAAVSVDSTGANVTTGEVGVNGSLSAPDRKEVKLEWDGNTGIDYCLPGGPNSCYGFGLPLGPEPNNWYAPKLEGVPVAVEASLSWSASSPFTNELGFAVRASKPCGQGGTCSRWLESASGVSPLKLKVDAVKLEKDEYLSFAVRGASKTPDPIYSEFVTDQRFKMQGKAVIEISG